MAIDFEVISGNTKVINVSIRGKKDAPVDVSSAQAITYGVFHDRAIKVIKRLGFGISVASDVVTVRLEATDTASLLVGQYNHELQIVTVDGEVHTVHQGRIAVKKGLIK